MPYNNASADGGHPGTYTSTGTIRSHPLTTEIITLTITQPDGTTTTMSVPIGDFNF